MLQNFRLRKAILNISKFSKAMSTTTTTKINDNQLKKIGTHNGAFHCDESLACFMIKKLKSYENSIIIRTRNNDELKLCDIVVDVGGIYDPNNNRFDHHQKTFNKTLNDIIMRKNPKFGNIKLSSAGLIYAHFGHEIIANILNWNKDEQCTDVVFDMIYENFVKEIDGIDNGITMFPDEPLYHIHTHLSKRVANLKPQWNEEENDDILYERFMKAIDLVGNEFIDCVKYYGNSWFPARKIVKESFDKRFDVDPSGHIVVLNIGLPWIQHLFQIEIDENCIGEILFVIFPDRNNWHIRAVPLSETSFELRNPLNEQWRGLLSGDDISSISNIDGCIFVHSTGFIGGNQTLDGAIKMAQKSLQQQKNVKKIKLQNNNNNDNDKD